MANYFLRNIAYWQSHGRFQNLPSFRPRGGEIERKWQKLNPTKTVFFDALKGTKDHRFAAGSGLAFLPCSPHGVGR
jgi:hypothetical protein